MRFMAARFAQELVIKRLYVGVLMRAAHGVRAVDIVKHLCAFRSDIGEAAYGGRLDYLTAAVYTAARACHYLNKVIACLAALDLFKQRLCVGKTACDSDLDFHASHIVGGFLDALHAAYVGKFDGSAVGFACQLPYRRPSRQK